jgi:hypothetical protein
MNGYEFARRAIALDLQPPPRYALEVLTSLLYERILQYRLHIYIHICVCTQIYVYMRSVHCVISRICKQVHQTALGLHCVHTACMQVVHFILHEYIHMHVHRACVQDTSAHIDN